MSTEYTPKTILGYELNKDEMYSKAKDILGKEYVEKNDGYDAMILEKMSETLNLSFNHEEDNFKPFVIGYKLEESCTAKEAIKLISDNELNVQEKCLMDEEPKLLSVLSSY